MSDYFVYESDYPDGGTIITAASEEAAIAQYQVDTGFPEETPGYIRAVEVDYCHQCHRLKESAAPIQEEDGVYCACTAPTPHGEEAEDGA